MELILLAIYNNLITACAVLTFTIGIVVLIATFIGITDDKFDPGERNARFKASMKKSYIVLACIAFLSLLPSTDELWKSRIALLKLELASPKNVNKSVEEISRIASKLECKYLGCKEKEANK